jgi:adenylate cyclase
MSIRTKFFALAGILLLLFGAVVGLLTLLQDATAHKLAGIVYYHQPLRRTLADLDVDTFEYDLRINRLLLRSEVSRPEWQAEAVNIEQVGARIRKNFDALRPGLEAAVAHNHDNPNDLYVLSTMQGALPFIDRQVEPFLALGRQVIDALLAARLDEARTLALGFARYNEAFGPDLGQLRQHLAILTEKAATGI